MRAIELNQRVAQHVVLQINRNACAATTMSSELNVRRPEQQLLPG
jgi:hypothetical protein